MDRSKVLSRERTNKSTKIQKKLKKEQKIAELKSFKISQKDEEEKESARVMLNKMKQISILDPSRLTKILTKAKN